MRGSLFDATGNSSAWDANKQVFFHRGSRGKCIRRVVGWWWGVLGISRIVRRLCGSGNYNVSNSRGRRLVLEPARRIDCSTPSHHSRRRGDFLVGQAGTCSAIAQGRWLWAVGCGSGNGAHFAAYCCRHHGRQVHDTGVRSPVDHCGDWRWNVGRCHLSRAARLPKS